MSAPTPEDTRYRFEIHLRSNQLPDKATFDDLRRAIALRWPQSVPDVSAGDDAGVVLVAVSVPRVDSEQQEQHMVLLGDILAASITVWGVDGRSGSAWLRGIRVADAGGDNVLRCSRAV
jgi:hypothetical protein